MTVDTTAVTVETHTLSFDDGPAVEVTIDDNGEVNVTVYANTLTVFSSDVWDDIVKFVAAAREMSVAS